MERVKNLGRGGLSACQGCANDNEQSKSHAVNVDGNRLRLTRSVSYRFWTYASSLALIEARRQHYRRAQATYPKVSVGDSEASWSCSCPDFVPSRIHQNPDAITMHSNSHLTMVNAFGP